MRSENITNTELSGQVSPDRTSISILAPAKINLFLKVLGKRPDGYHNIFSWFQTISLCDRLKITKTESGEIEISTNAENIPTGPDNLIYKAGRLFLKETNQNCGFRINLEKNIPVSAGLGGGSSDASAFIKAANRLLGTNLSRSEMSRIGLEIGSDLPFFFGTGQAEVTGRGEYIADTEFPIDYRMILVTPPLEIRAAEAYQKWKIDLTDPMRNISFQYPRSGHQNHRNIIGDKGNDRIENNGEARKLSDKLLMLESQFSFASMIEIVSGLRNDLEDGLTDSYPVLKEIKNRLEESGAELVRLSGSGPTIFALFTESTRLEEKIKNSLEGKGWEIVFAHPVILPA